MAENKVKQIKSVLATSDDGTVQLTITIPQAQVAEAKKEALKHIIEGLEVPGFRKGKVPEDIAQRHIEKQKLYEHALQHLLPEAYRQAVQEHSLKPVISPRFELLSTDDDSPRGEAGKDWSVRATTCELPEITLGDYKKIITGSAKAQDIWVPGKDPSGDSGQAKKPTREEKEQKVIKALFDSVEIRIPKLLVEEEVSHKLSQLLDQLQKLGVTIEQYLASTGKNVDMLRQEYAKQAEDSLKLVLSLNKIAETEKITVEDKEINEAMSVASSAASNGDQKTDVDPQQKLFVKTVLQRRKALDSLVNLI